ncbi:MAG: lamin tail domain-containing protein, partial [Ferruginibacter sp.]
MKKIFTLLAICLSGLIVQSQSLVISQIYGGSGNASATYNVDFIELFNPTGAAISTSGLSVQYASATGTSWSKFDLPAASIASGKYFLIQTTAAGANGVALPTTDASTTTINMSGSAGKVALVNGVVALSGATACSGGTVIDVVGFGTATTSCSESSNVFLTAGITTAQSIQRKTSGCTETNNNGNDFQLGTVTPRNSATAANPCGAPSALISASPNISNLTTTLGVASTVVSFNLSGSTLTPAAGDINAAASAGLEISLSAGGPFTSSVNVPYTGSTLAATPVYVRITSG